MFSFDETSQLELKKKGQARGGKSLGPPPIVAVNPPLQDEPSSSSLKLANIVEPMQPLTMDLEIPVFYNPYFIF